MAQTDNRECLSHLPPKAVFFLKILFIYFQREGKGERTGRREISMCGCLSSRPPPATGDLDCNPGMCPDWESNQ